MYFNVWYIWYLQTPRRPPPRRAHHPGLLALYPEYNKSSCVVMLSTIMFLETSTLLLGIIALDRYIAIIHPLRYHSLLTERTTNMLAAGCWVTGAIIYTGKCTHSIHLYNCLSR